jgi:hypothetical protein
MAFCQISFLSRLSRFVFCDAARFGFAVTLLGTAATTAVLAGGARFDTSAIGHSELRSNNTIIHDWRKFNIVRGAASSFHDRRHSQTAKSMGGASRNAIGLAVNAEDSDKGGGMAGRDLVRATVEPSLNVPAGAAAKSDQGIGKLDGMGQISAPAAGSSVTRAFPAVSTLSRSAVNGSTLPRLGSGTAVLGGPAKNLTGVINGVDFRPKHH